MTVNVEVVHPDLAIQRACNHAGQPGDSQLRQWAAAALADCADCSLVLRIVDEPEGRALNRHWRNRDHATNVLSFPADLPDGTGLNFLGDIVLCAPVIAAEASEQGKEADAHWAHLVVHGVLHLRGMDHMSASQAEEMERREIEILAGLGIADPYRCDEA